MFFIFIYLFRCSIIYLSECKWENFEMSLIIRFTKTKNPVYMSELESIYSMLKLFYMEPFIYNVKEKPPGIDYEPFQDLYDNIDMGSPSVRTILEGMRHKMEYINSSRYYNTYVDMVNDNVL